MRKSLLAKTNVRKFPKKKDEIVEQPTPIALNEMPAHRADLVPDLKMETANDQAALQFLDQVLAGHNPDKVSEDNQDELFDTKADIQDIFRTWMLEQQVSPLT